MRTIEWAGQFKRDYKHEAKGKFHATLDAELCPVIGFWANDQVRITEIMGWSATGVRSFKQQAKSAALRCTFL